MSKVRLLAAALFLAAVPAHADGTFQNTVTGADKERLQNYDNTRKSALAEAHVGGSREDVATLDKLLAKPAISFQGFDMAGNWKCRTIKAGGLGALVVYDWFKCKVTDDGSGWMLEKVTGSQRTKGRFFDESDTRLHYLGSFFIAGEAPKPYGSGPETDQAGFAFRTGAREWRIEFPAPYYESKLDIIEFTR